jgi:putative phage-type endonuclease
MKRSVSDMFGGCVDESEVPCKKPLLQDAWQSATPEHHWDIDYGAQVPKEQTEDEAEAFPTGDPITATDYYNKYVARTPEQCTSEGCAPQRSVEWKTARRFAITASDFGAALGNNAYCSPDDCVRKKVWDTFRGNDATQWGSTQEARAEEAFEAWAKANISEDAQLHTFNLTKFSEMPWIAVSPDGVVTYTKDGVLHADLVEYKCPTKTQTEDHPYRQHPKSTPPYYRDQMMGMLHYINANGGLPLLGQQCKLEAAWFVVWQPRTLWVVKHEVDESEWTTRIFPGLRSFYFTKLLPAFVWYHNGLLQRGDIEPQSEALEL